MRTESRTRQGRAVLAESAQITDNDSCLTISGQPHEVSGTTMRLTSYTDYTLRTLMYLAMHPEQLVTIQDIVSLHDISKNHLTKVVHQLGLSGLIETVRGRNGGIRLAKPADQIVIGDVIRMAESDFDMAECFQADSSQCAYARACHLKGVLHQATQAYLAVLDKVTLADITGANSANNPTGQPVAISLDLLTKKTTS